MGKLRTVNRVTKKQDNVLADPLSSGSVVIGANLGTSGTPLAAARVSFFYAFEFQINCLVGRFFFLCKNDLPKGSFMA